MSVPELSNVDIDRWFKNEPLYGGTYSKDLLPPLQQKAYVVNMEDSVDSKGHPLPGDHWMAVINTQPRTCLYYDSFGREPPLAILKRMKETGKRVVWSKYVEQPISSSECGMYACFVIRQLLDGHRWTDVIRHELQPARGKRNDRVALTGWREGQ
jgi:hypothetical protein